MTTGISFEELLTWNDESAQFWKAHLDAHPELLALPCDIGGTKTVQEFVRHIWGVELRWGQRLAGLPAMAREEMPAGPLNALFELHTKANQIIGGLLASPAASWDDPFPLDFDWIPPEKRNVSRRKVLAHTLFHSQRHWAQLATLVRVAGYASGFRGDLLLSSAFR
ncbi:MAG: DinB family protein [Terracidiphilus sp.]